MGLLFKYCQFMGLLFSIGPTSQRMPRNPTAQAVRQQFFCPTLPIRVHPIFTFTNLYKSRIRAVAIQIPRASPPQPCFTCHPPARCDRQLLPFHGADVIKEKKCSTSTQANHEPNSWQSQANRLRTNLHIVNEY